MFKLEVQVHLLYIYLGPCLLQSGWTNLGFDRPGQISTLASSYCLCVLYFKLLFFGLNDPWWWWGQNQTLLHLRQDHYCHLHHIITSTIKSNVIFKLMSEQKAPPSNYCANLQLPLSKLLIEMPSSIVAYVPWWSSRST